MSYSRSIGGYLAFDTGQSSRLNNYALLNLSRYCLSAIVDFYKIKTIQAPFYTCPVVWESIAKTGCEIIGYDINDNFLPVGIEADLPIIYTNYFGFCGKMADGVVGSCSFVIMDNAQAFYSRPRGKASVYSPRKFFPLADGGMLWPAMELPADLETDQSWERCAFLLKRGDLGAEAAYGDFTKNEKLLASQPMKKMSRLTAAMLASCDFEYVKRRRQGNFQFLHGALGKHNQIEIDLAEDDVPLVYPFRTENVSLRQKLLKNHIYVATYWPEFGDSLCMKSGQAKKMAAEIIPLPIDQRYGKADMQAILDVING